MATKSTLTTKKTSPAKAKAPVKTATSVKAKSPVRAKAPTPAKAPASAKTKKTATPSTAFSLYAPDAHEVYVIGDFNNWRTDNLKAKKFKDGTWRKSVPIKPGTYHYLFLVDGQWWTDPANPNRMQNPFGSENSVLTVG